MVKILIKMIKILVNNIKKPVFWRDILSEKEKKELELLEKNVEILKIYEDLYKEKLD